MAPPTHADHAPGPGPRTPLPPTASLRIEHGGLCGARLVTLRAVAAGECVAHLSDQGGSVEAPRATRYSIQVGEDRHVEPRGPLAFLNHSCAPNCVVDTAGPAGLALVALRDVAAGAELTFFYPATEWEMAEPFACRCGASECLGTIAGARHVAPERLRHYAVSPHIAALAAATSGAGSQPGRDSQ